MLQATCTPTSAATPVRAWIYHPAHQCISHGYILPLHAHLDHALTNAVCPATVYNYLFDKCGLVHITIGDGGNSEGLSGLGNDPNGHGARFRTPSFVAPSPSAAHAAFPALCCACHWLPC